MDELIARGEELLLDARRVERILIAGNRARALEIAEGGAAARIKERLDRSVGVLRRVVDLRDVVHRGHPVVQLREAAEQLADVNVLGAVHRRESEQDVLEVGRAPGYRARLVVDQHSVSEKAPERRLE